MTNSVLTRVQAGLLCSCFYVVGSLTRANCDSYERKYQFQQLHFEYFFVVQEFKSIARLLQVSFRFIGKGRHYPPQQWY